MRKEFLQIFLSDRPLESDENEDGLFYNYDIISKDGIRKKTISSLVPIYTGLIPKEQLPSLLKWIACWSGGKLATLVHDVLPSGGLFG